MSIIDSLVRAEELSDITTAGMPAIISSLKLIDTWSSTTIKLLPDDTIRKHPNLVPEWSIGAEYTRGDRVRMSCAIFKCIAKNTGSDTTIPLHDSEHWTEL